MGETTTTTTPCGGDFSIKILAYLPVKSLLRFKSVCKSWCSLIQSSFFIDLHTNTTPTTTTSKFGTFILQTTEPSDDSYEDNIKLCMLSSGDGNGDRDGEYKYYYDEDDQKKKMVIKVDDLGFLPFYKDFFLHDGLRMVGSCNGIICLHDAEVMDEHRGGSMQHYSHLRDVSLWNPATRQFRILPKSIPIEEKQEYIGNWLEDFIGFGFDVKTKDYKVLRITRWKELEEEKGGCMSRAQVYSLSTDSWRLLEDINYLPIPDQDRYSNHGIYLSGSYFFLGTKFHLGECEYMIFSFDFTKEIFTTMQLPDHTSGSALSYLGDKMAVFTGPQIDGIDVDDDDDDDDVFRRPPIDDGGYEHYDIWVLNKQHSSNVGVNKESWSKLHSFKIKRRGEYCAEPRCISNNGEFAIMSSVGSHRTAKLQLINLVTKEANTDFLIDTQQMCRASVYKESLVSIMGGGNRNVFLRWQQLPTHGTTCYKLNLDAPFIHLDSNFGIGLCLTSDTGDCIRVRSLNRYVKDATEGEALAMLEAIKWAKNLELSPIIIESDSKKCLSFFMDNDDDDNDNDNSTYWSSRALALLEKAKLLLLNNSSDELGSIISFQYCCSKRSCNYVTDVAATLARVGFWSCMDWTANDFPGEIVRSLSKNLGLETKKDWDYE